MKHVRLALIIAVAWTIYGIFASSQNYIVAYNGTAFPWRRALTYSLADAWLWALWTPLAFAFAGRLLVRRGNVWWTVPVLVLGGVLLGATHLFAFLRLLRAIGYASTWTMLAPLLRGRLHSDVLITWTLFGIRHAMEYYRRYRQREIAASRLQAQLARAQLDALRAQLQPHFLFNTLHAISALMYRDVDSADRMMTRLSDFLRLTLDGAAAQEVPLKREMEYLDKYLEIEQVRFGPRLEVEHRIDPATLDLLVPNLALQPLVENAVRHGIAARAAGGRIQIAASVSGVTLMIEVIDDGAGAAGEIVEGVGISNTRARLRQLYGGTAKLELGSAPGGGFRARLLLPAHTETNE